MAVPRLGGTGVSAHPVVLVPQDLGCETGLGKGWAGHMRQGESKWFTWVQKLKDAK